MGKVIAIVLAAAVLGGGGYFVYKAMSGTEGGSGAVENTSDTAQNEEQITEETPGEAAAFKGKGALKELYNKGRVQCTFAYTDEESQSTSAGTVYIADEYMRGDFTMRQNAEEHESHIIRDGENQYVWGTSPFGTMALKFPLETVMEGEDNNEPKSSKEMFQDQFDDTQEVDYDCKPWTVNTEFFQPPRDIEFQDIGAEMMQLKENIGIAEEAQCAACDEIPDAGAKAQCLEMLGCSQ